jgi:restriction endonuclease S subunit
VRGLPSGWALASLGDVVSKARTDQQLIKGKLSPKPFDGAVPAYSASGQDVWCSEAGNIGPGIVLSAVGARCGKAFLADGEWTAIANTHAFSPNPGMSARFVWYLVNNEDFWVKGGTAQPFVKIKASLQRTVVVPPTAEQERIVAVIEEQFSRLDAGVALLQRAKQRLAQLSRLVLWSAFPANWPTRPLVELTDPLRPICYGILKPKTVGSLVIPYVEVRSIQNGRIEVDRLHRTTQELHDEFRRSELCAGDVVLAVRGSFDRAAVVPPELTGGNVSRDVARIAPKSMLDSTFLAHYLGGPHAAAFFARAARGVGVRGVNIGDLRKMPVPIPSKRRQQQAVTEIERILSVIAAMTTEIDTALRRARTLRRSVLEQAFTGRLVYQDSNDGPASALLEDIAAKRDSSNRQKPTKGRGQRQRKVAA